MIHARIDDKERGAGVLPVLVIVAVILLGGVFVFLGTDSDKSEEAITEHMTDEMMEEDEMENMSDEEHSMMDDDEGMVDEMIEETMSKDMEKSATTPGVFIDYDETLLVKAETGKVVLLFSAPWCPSCRALEKDINANLSEIPSNTYLLKVDYDTETELKKKYGVVRQHTLVQVDGNGEMIKTLTGLTNTLNQVVSQI